MPDISDDRKPKKNPLNANFDKQEFKALWSRINRKAVYIEHLAYDPVEDKFDLDIFTAGQPKQDFSNAGDKLQRHIYDYEP